jgi:hypothetical protein
MKEVVADIKKKKEFATLDDTYIAQRVQSLLLIYPKLKKGLDNPKSREYRTMIKEVRSRLREGYGVFILKGYAEKKISDSDGEILATHRSSAERLHSYPQLYTKVAQSLSAVPSFNTSSSLKVIDLGCGMNPVSYAILKKAIPNSIRCEAYDISSTDTAFLNSYFKDRGIDGHAAKIDLTDEKEFVKINLSKANNQIMVCFLFKLLDTLESANRHITKKLMMHLIQNGADLLIITFPKKTIGGGSNIGENKRWWLEGFLQKENLRFEKSEVGDEIVYLVNK